MSRPQLPAGGRRLRVAFFHTTLPTPARKPGGAEVAAHRLANALADLGEDEVTMISAEPPPADARYNYRPFWPEARFLRQNWLARTFVLPGALNLFDFSRFDVLHIHGDDWFFFRRRLPTVRTLHGSALREAQHATSRKHRAFMYVVYGLEHLSVRLARSSVAVGHDAAALYGLHDVVSWGVDDTIFYPGPKLDRPRVLFVGTWMGRKRGSFVYDAFVRCVLPRFPDAELCMISDFCPEHPRVKWERLPSDRVLAQRFRESWVFALPSTYEGFGIPYLEALASATPVVATPNPGAVSVLEDGRHGTLAADDRFGEAIADLLGDDSRRAALAASGVRHATQHSWRAVALRHREIYLKALSTS
jgi:glycosyltransferase involved in cell wall biosynthesis